MLLNQDKASVFCRDGFTKGVTKQMTVSSRIKLTDEVIMIPIIGQTKQYRTKQFKRIRLLRQWQNRRLRVPAVFQCSKKGCRRPGRAYQVFKFTQHLGARIREMERVRVLHARVFLSNYPPPPARHALYMSISDHVLWAS